MKKQIALLLILSSRLGSISAQVWLEPFFASQWDTITLYYDATQGNAALTGVSQVYAHIGVITNLSSGPGDWQHVQGNWGTADPNVAMVNEGNNIHSISFYMPTFFSLQGGETVTQIACVFRNEDGSSVGRTSSQGDIFVPIYNGGFAVVITDPVDDYFLISANETFNVEAQCSESATLSVFVDDSLVASSSNAMSISYILNTNDFGAGRHYVWVQADNGNEQATDSAYYLFHVSPMVATAPSSAENGINYLSDTSVLLKFWAPSKSFVYLVGDMNDWQLDEQFLMHRSPDNNYHWIQLDGLTAGWEYRYQFWVDQELLKVADYYAEKVLDPWNDAYIPTSTYPDLIPYPTGKTNEIVSVFQPGRTPYDWDTSISFTRPQPEDLRVYELLIRDFTTERSFQAVIDTLDYLKRLGINAIELMPFNEFEGNLSWGYNPSFYFAVDKFYGTPDKLKTLIEEAHRRGIAVIQDMVLNHSFGQSPMVRLYFDGSNPTAQNPWFLETPAHDFNVGYDFDHESDATRYFVDRVMRYWVEEFHVDGYRMDLSKGFTSNVTIGNTSAFAQYDADRINNLKRMANELWNVDSSTYIILEHFANNDEEQELSDFGFLLWGNSNHDFTEASMGYGGDFSWVSYQNRGWDDAHLIGYAESHDEERLMFKNLNFGKQGADYNVRDQFRALERAELSAVFLLAIPGPKMIWQFGEMGYDLSINRCEDGTISNDCRLANKPPRWEYLEQGTRKRLFDVYAAMNNLRESQAVFSTSDYDVKLNNQSKSVHLNSDDINVTLVGNFDVIPHAINPEFQHTGNWYNYFTGELLEVNSTTAAIDLNAGEYLLYIDQQLELPAVTTGLDNGKGANSLLAFPNPASNQIQLIIEIPEQISTIYLTDQLGREFDVPFKTSNHVIEVDCSSLAAGVYQISAALNTSVLRTSVIIAR